MRFTSLVSLPLSLFAVHLLSGCNAQQSVNPFYFQENVIHEPRIIGEWQATDSSQTDTLAIRPLKQDSYSFEWTVFDKDKKRKVTMDFEAHLFRFRDQTYVDLFPSKFKIRGKGERYESTQDDLGFYAPVHTVSRLDLTPDGLSFSWAAETEALSLFKKEDPVAAREREQKEQERRVAMLTMSTEQLQREVLATADERSKADLGLSFKPKK